MVFILPCGIGFCSLIYNIYTIEKYVQYEFNSLALARHNTVPYGTRWMMTLSPPITLFVVIKLRHKYYHSNRHVITYSMRPISFVYKAIQPIYALSRTLNFGLFTN